MPEGGSLEIQATDGSSRISRAFTDADNEVHGELWTPLLRSSDINNQSNITYIAKIKT